jgi:hypothetical protein
VEIEKIASSGGAADTLGRWSERTLGALLFSRFGNLPIPRDFGGGFEGRKRDFGGARAGLWGRLPYYLLLYVHVEIPVVGGCALVEKWAACSSKQIGRDHFLTAKKSKLLSAPYLCPSFSRRVKAATLSLRAGKAVPAAA